MIKHSVGFGGKNYSLDVARVQKLLNQNLHYLNCEALLVDGEAGKKTILAIIEYQQKVLKKNEPNGLIETERNISTILNSECLFFNKLILINTLENALAKSPSRG